MENNYKNNWKMKIIMTNHIKILKFIFHRSKTNNHEICTEPQKTQNCQSNPGEK